MKIYSCPVCGSPPTNIKMAENDETVTYPCLYHAITSRGAHPCDGTVVVRKQEAYADKIAQNGCDT